MIYAGISYGSGLEDSIIKHASLRSKVLFYAITVISSTGVNIFILISGYFLVSTHKLKFDKFFHLYIQILFYLLIIIIYFLFVNVSPISFKEVLINIRPLTGPNYWFIKCYFALLLVAPFFSLLLSRLNQKGHIVLIIILLLIGSHITGNYFDTNNNLRLFLLLFSIGAYIKKYNLSINYKYLITALLIVFSMQIVMSVRDSLLGVSSSNFRGWAIQNNSITIFTATCIFLLFKSLTIPTNKFILNISSLTFGIYLIHDNNFIRTLLWDKIFTLNLCSSNFIPYSIMVSICVFGICAILDYIRTQIFSILKIKKIEKYISKYNIDL